MGLLSEGTPLTWAETKKVTEHVRHHGIEQFINHYAALKDRKADCLKWGDEIEYIIVKFDHKNKTAKVSLCSTKLLEILTEAEEKNPKRVRSLWRPEYAEYMVEGTPGQPYGALVQHFNIVEHNMAFRRKELQSLLKPDEMAFSISNFFRLGCPNFTSPSTRPDPTGSCSRSLFFPDEAINQSHPRFKTLTRNIRERRGEKVAINVPIFVDKNTPRPFVEEFVCANGTVNGFTHGTANGDAHNVVNGTINGITDGTTNMNGTADMNGTANTHGSTNREPHGCANAPSKPDHIYLDAMGFGMGCCCLQMTFQTRTAAEARVLYDHLTPLCPIMLALTAASPIFRGHLADVDCRWDVISGSVDCRTRQERGEEPLTSDKFQIPKSRYSSVDMYLSDCGAKYNDTPAVFDPAIFGRLVSNGVDAPLASHISHLFARDSISVFSEKIHQDDRTELDHFENIQSTNWQTMRFKVPPANSNIGWRVEFRPCEVQITDFENAAFGVFIVLLTRAILTYRLNMLIPISKVDENMLVSQRRNAVLQERFWFRRDIFSRDCDTGSPVDRMTIDQIMNGKGDDFVGLVPLVTRYLGSLDCDADTACTVRQYLKLISLRASGRANTAAKWIRNFVDEHPEYKHDSVVSERISYDLLVKIGQVSSGESECPELLGITPKTKTAQSVPNMFLDQVFCNGDEEACH